MARRDPRVVYAVRKNADGSVTRRIFGFNVWSNLAPIVKYDPMGGKVEIPKQGYEQVPEGWNEPAPEPLKADVEEKPKRRRRSAKASEESPAEDGK